MSTAVERGCLLLADISGYSAYLAGVELEHSADILADLLGAVVEQTRGPFTIAKLEGDAVFAYAKQGVETDVVFATLEAAYATFAGRTRTIGITSTCPCRACKGVGDLDLKFIIHCGEFARHDVAGNAELVGSDVVLAHRLLKNSVTESSGLRGYALFTEAAVSTLGLDVHDIGMVRHVEHYPDIGEVPGWVIDLATRWADAQAQHPIFVTPEEAYQTYACDTSLDPATIWELTTVPTVSTVTSFGRTRSSTGVPITTTRGGPSTVTSASSPSPKTSSPSDPVSGERRCESDRPEVASKRSCWRSSVSCSDGKCVQPRSGYEPWSDSSRAKGLKGRTPDRRVFAPVCQVGPDCMPYQVVAAPRRPSRCDGD